MSQAARYVVLCSDSSYTLGAEVVLAGSSRERRRGLLDQEQLSSGSGLWIYPCEAVHTFGMKFPIDIVFLDSRERVLKTKRGLSPKRVAICLRAKSVLELPAGTLDDFGVRPGDSLLFERIRGENVRGAESPNRLGVPEAC